MTTANKTIFVTIPAYNDPSLIKTIEGALDNALYPENIFFCIGMQYDDERYPGISKYINNRNFKFLFYDVKKRPGVYWIRREMAEQYSGQDYFLMIDSHMVFAKYWDAKLINDYEDLSRLHGERVIISRPTMEYVGDTIENGSIDDMPHWKVDWSNDSSDVFRTIIPWVSSVHWDGERYKKTLYSCNHFFFTRKEYLSDVGFHQGIRAYTEEYTIAISSFLSGWDYYFVPEYIHIGHDDKETTMSIYGKDKYTVGQGKRYQALFESEEEKREISKFIFLDDSSMFKVKNQRRNIDDFYELAGEDLKKARQAYISMLGL